MQFAKMLMRKSCVGKTHLVILIFILVGVFKSDGYEKTLRKIVREKSKMVQRPFTASKIASGVNKTNSVNVKMRLNQGNVSGRNTFYQNAFPTRTHVEPPSGKAQIHTRNNKVIDLPTKPKPNPVAPIDRIISAPIKKEPTPVKIFNISIANNSSIPPPKQSPYFNFDDSVLQRASQVVDSLNKPGYFSQSIGESVENITLNKENKEESDNLIIPTTMPPRTVHQEKPAQMQEIHLIHTPNNPNVFTYNISLQSKTRFCSKLPETIVDIDAREKLRELEINPAWCVRRTFWNYVFENRYNTLMSDLNWPPLEVIMIPRSQVDIDWRLSPEQHYTTGSQILSNIVKKMQFYENMTFSWNEVSQLSRWWYSTTSKNRSAFRRLVKSGRLEITTGFWVEPEEATSTVFSLVHQLIQGHQWLKENINYVPKNAWLTSSTTHSSCVPYLLSSADINYLVMTKLHYAFVKYLAEYQYSDFIWVQNWENDVPKNSILNEKLNRLGTDKLPANSVFTHYLQFNSAEFKSCGPNRTLCTADFSFAKIRKSLHINSYNVHEKAEILLEQYSKTGTLTSHNTVMAPLGAHNRYDTQSEIDYQYNNYNRLADFINSKYGTYRASVRFGTTQDYFNSIIKKNKNYPTLKGDFLIFGDVENGKVEYGTSHFSCRPQIKLLMKNLQSILRTSEILLAFAVNYNALEEMNLMSLLGNLEYARQSFSRLSDINVSRGTFPQQALNNVYTEILHTVKQCWRIQEICASLLTTKPGFKSDYLLKYSYRNGEFSSIFQSVMPGDQIYIFNSLTYERTEVVELVTKNPYLKILDHDKKPVVLQINPIWKYTSQNMIHVSKTYFKVLFTVVVPPMTFELYSIESYKDSTSNAATIYCMSCVIGDVSNNSAGYSFPMSQFERGDIRIENFQHRLIFDEKTGLLKTIVNKASSIAKTVNLDYGSYKELSFGFNLFKSKIKPLEDIIKKDRSYKGPLVIVISGKIKSEVLAIYGDILEHATTIYHAINCPLSDAIQLHTKIDHDLLAEYGKYEMFLSIQSGISNGLIPEIVTDTNGFYYTPRSLNFSTSFESNTYPVTNMVFIEDRSSRMTLIVDQAQGVTALQEGQLIFNLNKFIPNQNNHTLGEIGVSRHKYFLLYEEIYNKDMPNNIIPSLRTQQLPSLTAVYLSNVASYPIDLFKVDSNKVHLPYYMFFPLISKSFPCDVSLVNFRVIPNKGINKAIAPTKALLVLQRQSFSCGMSNFVNLNCDGDSTFLLERILRNVKVVYKTNLSGTNKGGIINSLDLSNFPPMELVTLRLHY